MSEVESALAVVKLQLAADNGLVFGEEGNAEVSLLIGGNHQGADWRGNEIKEKF